MQQIYKSKHFGYIDLAKIISITEPKVFRPASLQHVCVGFKVIVQLRDEELAYQRFLEEGEMRWVTIPNRDGYQEIATTDGEWNRYIKINMNNETTVAQANLQEEINDLVNAWESYCTAHAVSQFPPQPRGKIWRESAE